MTIAKALNRNAKRTPVAPEHTTAPGLPPEGVERETSTSHIETNQSGLPEKVIWWVGDPFS